MVVDTSALITILFQEDDWELYAEAILNDASPRMSAASFVEAYSVALGRKGPVGAADVERLRLAYGVALVPFDSEQLEHAQRGVLKYGRSRHKAKLNLGDSFAYGLAMHLDEPLLFKGKDFAQTDVKPAL